MPKTPSQEICTERWKNLRRGFLEMVLEISYFFKKNFKKLHIPDNPMLGKEEKRMLADLCATNSVILEYGSGASTRFLAEKCKEVITVESDRKFLQEIIRKNSELTNVKYLYANIGPTKSFGQPVIFLKLFFKNKWKSYGTLPWEKMAQSRAVDVIFVDGRFRVACALNSVLLNERGHFSIVVDDFYKRPEYQVLRSTLGEPKKYGFAALFEIEKSHIDLKLIQQTVSEYELDFR